MITFTAVIRAKSGQQDALASAPQTVAQNIAENEPDTVGFFISQDLNDPRVFTTYERFTTPEATAQDLSEENRFTCEMTQDAASNRSPRIAASPHFDTRPDQSISPDWCRFGVKPRKAPTSEVLLNLVGSSTRATKLSDTIGPTPGIVIKRRVIGWLLDFACKARSISAVA